MTLNVYIIKVILVLLFIFLFGYACNRENSVVVQNIPIRLYTGNVDAGAENNNSGSDKAVFLFWNFGDWISQAQNPSPLYVKYPEGNISDYARPSLPYDTDELYPDGNLRVVVTGYAPSSLQPVMRLDNTANYEILTLPEGISNLCTTDVLTSVVPIVGSSALPFDRENGETLMFMHAQSKVVFYAKLADNMGKFIKNVRIQLDESVVGTSVVWDRSTARYSIATGDQVYTMAQQGDDQLSRENSILIGEAFIAPGNVSVPVTFTIERSSDVQFTASQEVTFESVLNFSITRGPEDIVGNDNTLYANESYTFTVVFREEGIELLGSRTPWEDGGYLPVPIYPIE